MGSPAAAAQGRKIFQTLNKANLSSVCSLSLSSVYLVSLEVRYAYLGFKSSGIPTFAVTQGNGGLSFKRQLLDKPLVCFQVNRTMFA